MCPPPQVVGRQRESKRRKTGGGGAAGKGRDWVLRKKDRMRHKGYETKPDTKYTARKRKHMV